MARRPQIWHWRQDDEVKNFGDYLADFLSQEMFEPISWHDGPVHVIGSVIADFLVPESDTTDDGRPQPKVVFWGCGARDENGLSEDRMGRASILAVRGPKTASVLKLGAAKPQGDIAFFLPALYEPRRLQLTAGKSVCIPHFWDRRPDSEFAEAGCDVVLRTNIAAGPVEIRRVIDSIVSADFVLTASLHGAVVAAAYGVPFAFWDNGHIDLPFKWQDLAAYLSIPDTFYTRLSDAKAGYEAEIKERLKLPPLWSFLACAPFPIRPAAMIKIMRKLWASSGAEATDASLKDLLDELEHATAANEVAANAFMDQVANLKEAVNSALGELALAEVEKARLAQLKDDLGGVAAAQEIVIRERDEQIAALKEGLANIGTAHAELMASADARGADRGQENASLKAAQDHISQIEDRLTDSEARAKSLAVEILEAREKATAAARNLERLAEMASGLRNDSAASEHFGFDDPADMQVLFQNVATAIDGLKCQAQADAEALARQTVQNLKLTDDATAALKQLADVREQLRMQSNRILEEDAVRVSLTARLEDTRRDLECALGERRALEILAVEQDLLLKQSQAHVAALSRQVQLAGTDAENLRRRVADAEALRQSAQRRYEKIAGSATWTMVRRSRKVREYFTPHRMKQRWRRVVRILTGKKRSRPLPSAPTAVAPTVPSQRAWTSQPDLSVFIVALGRHEDAAKAAENVARIAESGAQIILCGDVKQWEGSPYITVPSVAANVVDHIDHHLKTSSSIATVVVFGSDTQLSGDLSTFPEIFSANPLMVACSALEVDHEGRVVAAGATRDKDGLVPLGAGLSPTDFRIASVHATDFLWPLVVAIDADGFRHLGGLGVERSGEDALVAFAIEARRRGLEVGVNPFVRAVRRDPPRPIQLSAEVERTADALVRNDKPKVLFTDATTPTPDRDSGSIDIYWYMRIFLELGYEVTFLPVQDRKHAGRYTAALQILGIRCPLDGDVGQAWEFLRDFGSEFDLVMAYRASSACHVIDPIREFAPQARVVFDTVDLHFLREQRAAELSGSADDLAHANQTRIEELKIMRLSDATILLSSLEYDYIGEISPETRRYLISIVRDVPGVGAPAAGRQGAMFVGGFKHAPNTDAALFLCSEIWPRVRSRDPLAELSIIGADVPPEIQALHNPAQGINVVGFVEDLDPFYKTIRVNLAPLRYGAGVKGKVAASLSVGLPTVATPTAVEGMFLEHERDVIVCEDPEAFAEGVVRLFRDDVLWEKLSRNAVKAAQDTFSIDAARSRLKIMLGDLGLPTG